MRGSQIEDGKAAIREILSDGEWMDAKRAYSVLVARGIGMYSAKRASIELHNMGAIEKRRNPERGSRQSWQWRLSRWEPTGMT